MSRIGKKPIELPAKVKVNVGRRGAVTVEGPKGKLAWTLPKADHAPASKAARFPLSAMTRPRQVSALHGLSRALINNMVTGVNAGFAKDLEIQGVGFKAAVKGRSST